MMDQDRSWSIRTSDLKVGTTLGFDLTDRTGRVVLKAGQPFNEEARARLLALGVETVTILVMPQEDESERELLASYDPDSVRRLQTTFTQTHRELQGLFEALQKGHRAEVEGVRTQLDGFFAEAVRDTSTALGVIAAQWKTNPTAEVERLMLRSARLSWIAMITGIATGMGASDAVTMGVAGALHDVSIFFHPEWLDEEYRRTHAKQFMADYQRHSLESAEILRLTAGLNERQLTAVTQVHEQMDGSGFPRGLRAVQIVPPARILNVVDAYLEIVDPLFRRVGVVHADALAQLCLHATQGVFDRESVQGLIEIMSLYPIGSVVELSDNRRAVVIRSSPKHPLQPVVRFLDGSHSIADLRTRETSIQRPVSMGSEGRRRLSKMEMQIPLWDGSAKHDFY